MSLKKYSTLRERVANKFLGILDLPYLKLRIQDFKQNRVRFRIESMRWRWVPKITLGIM